MQRKALAQIVITRRDDNTFKVATFDKKECLDDETYSEQEAIRLVAEAMKRLRVVEGL
jgi:hypothetical protein